METKKEVITIAGIQKKFNISRATFYQQYRANVEEVPTTGKKCLYDYQSVVDYHTKRLERKNNTNYKIIA